MLKTSIFVIVLVMVLLYLWSMRKKVEQFREMVYDHVHANDIMRETLVIGLYYRFGQQNQGSEGEQNSKESDSASSSDAFGHFVADIVRKVHGGKTYVISYDEDSDLVIEHDRSDGLYLGLINCGIEQISFERIAILHSHIIKQNAQGGFFITTASFSETAQEYAKGLPIELIDGGKLVELWLESLKPKNSNALSLPRLIS